MFRRKKKAPKPPRIKGSKKQKKLLAQYEQGRILQANNEKDNKEYFKSLEENNG